MNVLVQPVCTEIPSQVAMNAPVSNACANHLIKSSVGRVYYPIVLVVNKHALLEHNASLSAED